MVSTALPQWLLRPDPMNRAKTLHPFVQASVALAGAEIVLIGLLFRMEEDASFGRFVLSSAAMWGSAAVMLGCGVVVLWAQTRPRKPSALNSESNTAALIVLMILGFFELVMAGRAHAAVKYDYAMEIAAQSGELSISGAIGPSLPRQVETLLESGQVSRVVLRDNGGGDIMAAVLAAYHLQESGITQVRVEGDCASSCAFLALLLPERSLAPGARMGFHDVRNFTGSRNGVAPERAVLKGALMQAGHSAGQIEMLLSSDEIVWLSVDELEKAKLMP